MRDFMALSTREKYRHISILLILIIIPGFVILLPGSTIETIMEEYGFRESIGGLINIVYFLGTILGILLLTRLIKLFSTKRLLVGVSLVLSVSLILCAMSPWYPVFLIIFFF